MALFLIIYAPLFLVIAWCVIASAVRYAIRPLVNASAAARLEKLENLHTSNSITPEEYEAKRQEILKDL